MHSSGAQYWITWIATAVFVLAQTGSPLAGTWKLNLAKSTFDPGPMTTELYGYIDRTDWALAEGACTRSRQQQPIWRVIRHR
jgi:hypothetical protein